MSTIDNSISTVNSILGTYSAKNTGTKSTTGSSSTTDASASSQKYSDKTSLGRYVNGLSSSDDASAKTIFEKVSIDVGGDGKSMTKDQLDSYIKNATNSNGTTNIPKEELSALKTLQSNWGSIAEKGSDSISYDDVLLAGKKSTLQSMVPDTTSTTKTDYKKIADDATAEAYGRVKEAALNFSAYTKNTSTSDLTSTLKSLLTGTSDENDDSNAEMIATLTNLIANSKKTSTVETEA